MFDKSCLYYKIKLLSLITFGVLMHKKLSLFVLFGISIAFSSNVNGAGSVPLPPFPEIIKIGIKFTPPLFWDRVANAVSITAQNGVKNASTWIDFPTHSQAIQNLYNNNIGNVITPMIETAKMAALTIFPKSALFIELLQSYIKEVQKVSKQKKKMLTANMPLPIQKMYGATFGNHPILSTTVAMSIPTILAITYFAKKLAKQQEESRLESKQLQSQIIS